MYKKLQAGAQDENKRADGFSKGSSLANNNLPLLQQPTHSRRALGDIGNLVGALSARCTLSKDGLAKPQQPKPAIAGQPVRQERPITRKFSANLANNTVLPSSQVLVPHPAPQSQHGEAPLSWRTKQRRTMAHHQPPGRDGHHPVGTEAVASEPALESKALPPICGQPRRVMLNRGLPAAKKTQTLTATLTARSEAVCGGSEVEMEEAEDLLPNIDEDDMGNQLAVVDYVEDIYSFYRKSEIHSCVAPDYMLSQMDINEKMRAILVDWLTDVHLKFKLMPETLFLAANLIDRYLACQSVLRKNLQLVGVTAMLLACKYEEIWAPVVDDFVFISDNAYTKEQLLDMEKSMLNKLKFNLTVPTPYVFLVRFLKAAGADTQLEMMAFFLAELCLTEYSMMKYCPSLLAAAAVYAAQQTLQHLPCWSTTLQRHSGYTEMHLRDCASKMVSFHQKAQKGGGLTVVTKKYSNSKFNSVAFVEPTKFLVE